MRTPRALLCVAIVTVTGCSDGSTGSTGGSGGGTGGSGGDIDAGEIMADAGVDQEAAEGTIVTLEGMGDGPTFSWRQLSGPAVTLNTADEAIASFEAPWIVEESVLIELELTVNDGTDSATDRVVVTITNTHFVLFLADKEQTGRVELYRAPLDGESEPIKLSRTPVPNGEVKAFVASRDGRYVAYSGDIVQDGVDELFVVASGGGDSTKLNGPIVAGGGVSSFGRARFQWSPDGNRIAYRADQDNDNVFELYNSAPDGSSNVKLNGALDQDGDVDVFAWSPDSSRIAYIADQDTNDVTELYSSAPDGGNNVKLNSPILVGAGVCGNVCDFLWSPDSSRIAYLAFQDAPNVFELYGSAPDGNSNVKLNGPLMPGGTVSTALPRSLRYSWSPDSSRIAYLAFQNATNVLEAFSSAPDGSGNVRLNGPLVADGGVRSLFWSPDSSRIAYLADQENDNVFELYGSAPDGTDNVKISGALAANEDVLSLSWSPDSSRIAYLAGIDMVGPRELYSSAPDGSGNVKLNGPLVPGGSVSSFTLAWSPDSSRIAYRANQDTDNVFELYSSAPDGTGNVKLNGPLVQGGGISLTVFLWSPDSSRIAYLADQDTDNVDELYSSAPDGTSNAKLSGELVPGGRVRQFTVE